MQALTVPPEIVDSFHGLVSVEIDKIDRRTRDEISQSIFEASRRGMLSSSVAMGSVAEVAGNTISVRAQAAFNILLRSLTAHGVAVDSGTKAAVKDLLAEFVNKQVAHLKAMVQDTAPFKSGVISGREELLSGLDELGSLEVRRLSGEIGLIAAQNDRAEKQSGGSPTFIFNAPVGMVQSGPGSVGSVVQHIDTGAKDALAKAFDQLTEALKEDSSDQSFDAAEVIELVADARSEVAKETPNTIRLKALVGGIGGAIAFVPKLKEAYDTLRWAAGMVGVALP